MIELYLSKVAENSETEQAGKLRGLQGEPRHRGLTATGTASPLSNTLKGWGGTDGLKMSKIKTCC